MSQFDRKKRNVPEEMTVFKLHFIGEQSGLIEDALKQRLYYFFERDKSVNTAYLARVSYEENGDEVVALCLQTHFGLDNGMAEKVGKIFSSMFAGNEHLDIVFLTSAQEGELREVCPPFFRMSRP